MLEWWVVVFGWPFVGVAVKLSRTQLKLSMAVRVIS